MSGEDEVTHLPASLQKFFKVTLGMEWPEGSEGGLRAISQGYMDFAEALAAAAADTTVSAADIEESLRGVVGSNIVDFVGHDMNAGLLDLQGRAEELAKASRNAAADIQKAKIMLIAMAALALATVISLIASLFGAFLVPGVLAAARLGIMGALRLLLSKITQTMASLASREALKQTMKKAPAVGGRFLFDVGKYAVGGAAFMGGLDLGIQVGQNIDGKINGGASGRDGIDWESVKNMTIGGLIGGAGAGAAANIAKGFRGGARGAGKDVPGGTDIRPNIFGKPTDLKTRVDNFNHGLGDLGYAGAQVTAVVLTNPLVNKATGGHGDIWDGVLGAAARGPGGGAGSGGA
ncbi:MAG: hypothetical protein ABW212_07995, partial [Pseudonocardia sediminis]